MNLFPHFSLTFSWYKHQKEDRKKNKHSIDSSYTRTLLSFSTFSFSSLAHSLPISLSLAFFPLFNSYVPLSMLPYQLPSLPSIFPFHLSIYLSFPPLITLLLLLFSPSSFLPHFFFSCLSLRFFLVPFFFCIQVLSSLA